MSAEKESVAFQNMKRFWSTGFGKELVKAFEENNEIPVSNYIMYGDCVAMPVDDWLEQHLKKCRYLIITANPVESQTIKRMLYEEAKDRKIYKYWMATKRGKILSDEHDPQDPTLPGKNKEIPAQPDQDLPRRSPKLLAIDLGKEVQYYFATLGGTEQDGTGELGRPIKIAYICPSNTSSFSGNGSHKAIVHALRRYPRNEYPFIASLGVAFGLRPSSANDQQGTQQCLGDVLISQNIIAYDSKYKVTGETAKGIGPRFKMAFSECEKYSLEIGANRAFSGLVSRPGCRPFKTDLQDNAIQAIEKTLHIGDIRCHLGALYSGGAVVSSPEFKKSLMDARFAENGQPVRTLEPIGGEMEGVGIWYACLLEDDQFPCIVIKGICDWGEEKNGWAKLLKQNDRTYFEKKVKELLPQVLKQRFQYDDGEAAAGLADGLAEAFQKDDAQRKEALTAIARQAAELGISGRPKDIRETLENAYLKAEDAVNDRIKDAIQAYATGQAFKTFCHTIYDDVQLAYLPARTPNESEAKKENKKLKQDIQLWQTQMRELEAKIADLQKNAEIQSNQLKLKNEELEQMRTQDMERMQTINLLTQNLNFSEQLRQELIQRFEHDMEKE